MDYLGNDDSQRAETFKQWLQQYEEYKVDLLQAYNIPNYQEPPWGKSRLERPNRSSAF